MTNSQQKFLASLQANVEAAKAVGLHVQIEVSDLSHFVSVSVRVNFPTPDGPRRYGHDQEFYTHVMIGRRGGLIGECRIGSFFSPLNYCKWTKGLGESYRSDIFELNVRNGCKFAIDDMIDTANRMNKLNKGAAA